MQSSFKPHSIGCPVSSSSACFLIPFGYQTHLMVYSPGRYRLVDYLKTGLPVSLAYSVAVLVITPLVFPF
jgi:di/tricarboxylate transporter